VTPALDHIVVAARTLADGIAWCEAALGIIPAAGGQHPLMGTHNRIFTIATPRWPQAYLEIIAIDPAAAAPGRQRWFGLDEPALQRRLESGPRLAHWVARCADVEASAAALRGLGCDVGPALAAQRPTPAGLLRWRITVRPDGRRLFDGALPTLIEWGEVHPSQSLPDSGVALAEIGLGGLPTPIAAWLGQRAGNGEEPAAVAIDPPGAAPLRVVLDTPRGRVTLEASPTES
jgi:hypothetical protein